MNKHQQNIETAIFAAGCFWGVEAAFRREIGVIEVESGYTGGEVADPSYEQVCRGDTGHAEAVRIIYDAAKTSYEALLMAFWACHDPTQKDRQGPDIGRQYRSAIFHHDESQAELAKASMAREAKRWPNPIATELVPAGAFYRAEEYHQNYHAKLLERRRG